MKTARAAVRDAVYCPQQGVFYFQNVMQSYGTDVHVTVFTVQTYVTVFTVQTYTSLYLRTEEKNGLAQADCPETHQRSTA